MPIGWNAEHAVIGAVLLEPDALASVVGMIEPADFEHAQAGKSFAAMLSLFAEDVPADPSTVADMMERRGGATSGEIGEYLGDCLGNTATPANIVHHARLVRDGSRRRQLAAVGRRLAEEAETSELSVEDLADRADSAVLAIRGGSTDGGLQAAADFVNSVYEDIEKAHSSGGSIPGLATGIEALDRRLLGLQDGRLIVLGARPGMGKSALAQAIAMNVAAATGKAVAFFSYEMPARELVRRAIASNTGINSEKLATGKIAGSDWVRVAAACGEFVNPPTRTLGNLLLAHGHHVPKTIEGVRAELRRTARRYEIGLVVIDYLQLMSVPGRQENQTQKITEISRGLKCLAMDFDVPVLALSQLSRAPEGRDDPKPRLADLRGSGSIEQDADQVLFLSQFDSEGRVRVSIAKNRGGASGDFLLEFRKECLRFASATEMSSAH